MHKNTKEVLLLFSFFFLILLWLEFLSGYHPVLDSFGKKSYNYEIVFLSFGGLNFSAVHVRSDEILK